MSTKQRAGIVEIDKSRSLHNVTILYLDSHAGYRDKLAGFLESQGLRLFRAGNSYDGLRQFKKHSPDILLIDIDLPDDESLKFFRCVKQQAPKTPILVLTALKEAELIVRIMHLGIKDYLFKPIDYDVMLERLQELSADVVMKKEHHLHRRLLEQYRDVVDRSNVISKTDPDGVITFANRQFTEISGYSEAELLGKTHRILRHPDNPASLYEELWDTITSKKIWHGTIRNRRKDGTSYVVDATIGPVLDENNEIVEFIAIRHDITDFVEQQQIIKRQSTDTLTQFPNREKLLEDLASMRFANLALINIDSFRDINDLYGFDTGDRVLREMCSLIDKSFDGTGAKLYKLPSDEYAVLIDSAGDVYAYQADIEALVRTINRHEFTVGENTVHVSVTAGIAHHQENILSHADIALKDARKLKKACLVYDESSKSKERKKENLYWNKVIKTAIGNGTIVPYYQPIMNSATGEIEKYEALARLIDENGQLVTPYYFLDIAKKYHLYDAITKTMIEQSFAYFEDKPYSFSINLSIEDILDRTTVDFILERVQAFTEPHRIVFEIIESEGIENFSDVRHFLQEVKKFGCQIAIDDFGSGYSNFEYILKLNIDYLKVDGSLIMELYDSYDARVVVETVLDFARKLGIKTVTEFVCNEEVYTLVKVLGTDYVQGYYIGEPAKEIAPVRVLDKKQ